jgi:hypothetical protein
VLTGTHRRWSAAGIVLAAGLCVGGCASTLVGADYGDHTNGYGVDFYEPFDNSRDYGPGYLVGPPNRPKLFPNDEGPNSSGKTLQLSPATDSAPSIPTTPPDRHFPPAPVLPPSPVN